MEFWDLLLRWGLSRSSPGAQPLMDFLERLLERGRTQDGLEQVDQ
jgi:hypothetical protein